MAMDMVAYSRLIEADEDGTLARQKALRGEVIDPAVAQHHGRVVKFTGDGALAEFPSAVEAVRCAIEIQRGVTAREGGQPSNRRIEYRIGVHVGDIVADEGDIYGNGVNVAARLEAVAEPNTVYISQQAYDQVEARDDIPCAFIGEQVVKNLARPIRIYRVETDSRSSAPAARLPAGAAPAPTDAAREVCFARSADGTMIAYASSGSGPAVIPAATWMSHLDYDWSAPHRAAFYTELARAHRLVRYDQRGNGHSDRDCADVSLDAQVNDIDAVANAAGIERFALYGGSQGGAVAAAYAARHPGRVTHLVLHGAYAQGWRVRGDAEEIKRREAMQSLIEVGWGTDNPAFHQMMASLFVPGASEAQIKAWIELQRASVLPKTAAALHDANGRFDIVALLPQIKAPTLVTHSRHDAVQPFEVGRKMASLIPGARFVALESRNHVILPQEPAWPRFIAEVINFLRH